MMKAVGTSAAFVSFYETARCNIPEESLFVILAAVRIPNFASGIKHETKKCKVICLSSHHESVCRTMR
jgi:hypothetical protein